MRSYRAGESVEDLCRACKIDRMHTVIVADSAGRPTRVQCDYCGSQHNFRGGPAEGPTTTAPLRPPREAALREGTAEKRTEGEETRRPALPLVSETERLAAPVPVGGASADLELLLRRIIRLEGGLTPVVPADKWRGGTLVLRPGKPGVQDKSWPIETFFHKIVMIRNRLRTLGQQVNGMDLAEDVKVKLQAYITGCYGSLTSFNILFADEDDQFKGSGEL
jgi:hypothetical protein